MNTWYSAIIVALLALPAPAFADDAYVCDGGRIVYARPETLEKLKQTDPCVQGYFKFQPTPAAPAQAAPDAPAVSQGTVREPGKAKPPGKSASADAAPGRAPPPATAGTDFRNVHVINAQGSDAVYHHAR